MAKAPVRRTLRQAGSELAGGAQSPQFFRETIAELKKVVWPTREQATRLAVLVIVISLSVGVFLGLIDMAFGQLFRLLI
ncbi:MAG: Protein translocase subunit SecE [Dehalococcoidia bacterium]|nr:Protein translocase subunit SecE [Dehalococcoidia bacterium]